MQVLQRILTLNLH